jgi:DNA-binding MarR family transcriptional regulator
LVAKKKRSQPSRSQLTLNQWQKQSFLEKLTPTQLKIIQLIEEGLYQAAIARQLGYSRSYICKFVNKLKQQELVTVKWRNPLTQRAISYGVTKELKGALERLKSTDAYAFILFTPHKIRYLYPIISQNVPVKKDINRFAAAKIRYKKSWNPKGGERNLFETNHQSIGKVGLIIHPQKSIEVYQAYRHPIYAKNGQDADIQLAVALDESIKRFQQEQTWVGVNVELGSPRLVGSPHYSFPSKIAKALIDSGQSQLKFMNGEMEIDKSLEKKQGEKQFAEIEGQNIDLVNLVDIGLKNAARIDKIVPELVKVELKGISETLLNINKTMENINNNYTNVAAVCQSGLPIQHQLNMVQTVVAKQGESIHLMQQTMLKLIENMSKILDKIEIKDK